MGLAAKRRLLDEARILRDQDDDAALAIITGKARSAASRPGDQPDHPGASAACRNTDAERACAYCT